MGSTEIAAPSITLIGGATASGKSALALDLAERTGAVIVNADSQQLYKGLAVLTAAPTEADTRRAPHLLYEIADPEDSWSVGRWLRRVERVLTEEQRPVILVGGTGLYFNALTKGLADIPPVPDALRAEISEAYDRIGEDSFRVLVAKADPQAAARITPGDRQRLIRALGVALATGKPLSHWRSRTKPLLRPGAYEAIVVDMDRDALYARCDARAEAMLEAGALDEVAALMARDLNPSLPAMKAAGVRELAGHLRGETPLEEALAAMKTATRQLAKRQLTWFRNQAAHWPRSA
ncbi:tRNA (adenosine(37)-N6)-dimethylallyltransferase MiaA [Brevundimonas sp.]|uniref:tRNA (adenosine(37)-N6)-dimethylallyltransferase MiaA n=1 Tax=Brevundimonas sp. TaxID=1871086 RepID=UPI0025DEF418|nr:tRNA (adenosine(37)-N6)-dimethylallyltransferase MiaA [Brevundimonas sp.]